MVVMATGVCSGCQKPIHLTRRCGWLHDQEDYKKPNDHKAVPAGVEECRTKCPVFNKPGEHAEKICPWFGDPKGCGNYLALGRILQ